MPRQEIAVIGGGAKAAAIAAKAYCLREANVADINVTIFERTAIGAHWDGAHGYTDGDQPLCTPAVRDLGFPYRLESFGAAVAGTMQAEFSWAAHAVLPGANPSWQEWVDRGAVRPTHRQFAGYLREAVRFSQARIVRANVTRLRFDHDWRVEWDEAGVAHRARGFDGVVVTSPGPSKRISPLSHPRLMTGDDFWRNLPLVRAVCAADPTNVIAIVGGGGTAAAVVAWLIRAGFRDAPIVIIADGPTLYARTYNFFENRMFTDDEAWATLTGQQRHDFNARLTQGVVWDTIAQDLAEAGNLLFRAGRVDAIDLDDSSDVADDERELVVTLAPAMQGTTDRQPPIRAKLVVDASGFDNWWFVDLLDPIAAGDCHHDYRAELRGDIRGDLSLPLDTLPGLHVPLIGSLASPCAASLMALGDMADRILAPYALRSRGGRAP